MADAKPSSGGFSRAILWLVILALLGAVWWLASERNARHFAVTSSNGQLEIQRGHFFPTGTGASSDPAYAPVAIPPGEKAPGELEFDDETALARFLFGTLTAWGRDLAKKGDTHAASGLVARAAQLPGITWAQTQELQQLSSDLAWDDALTDLKNASSQLESARRKLASVQASKGTRALDATALLPVLEGLQKNLDAAAKPAK